METEFICPSMDVRVEKEKLRKRPNVWSEKLEGERNLALRSELGGEKAPWVWKVEVRRWPRCV